MRASTSAAVDNRVTRSMALQTDAAHGFSFKLSYTPGIIRPWIHIVAGVLLPTVLAPLAGCHGGARASTDEDVASVARALGPWRPFPARISRLPRLPMDPGGHRRDARVPAVAPGVILRLRQAARSPKVADLQAAAKLELLTGHAQAALALLAEAGSLSPESAALKSDMAAAYLTAATDERETSTETTVRAIDAAASAVALDNRLAEGWFNLALGLERLGLLSSAAAAWRHVIEVDADPDWRAEASSRERAIMPLRTISAWDEMRRGIMTLKAELPAEALMPTDTTRQALRECVEEDLLPEWAKARLANNDEDSRRWLERAGLVSAGIAGTNGDPFLRDSVEVVRRASPSAADALARGHLAYAESRRRYEANDFEQAGQSLSSAISAFTGARSPFRWLAEYQRAIVDYQQRRLEPAVAALDATRRLAAERRYSSLESRAWLMRGIVNMQRNAIEAALNDYDAAYRHAHDAGESEALANVANTAADTLRIVGQHHAGWTHLGRALQALPVIRSARRRYVTLLDASLYAAESDMPAAALQFQNASLGAAQERGTANTLAEAHTRRAALYLRTGDAARAAEDLREAADYVGQIVSDSSRQYQQAWLNAVKGDYFATARPQEAFGSLDAALAYFERGEPAEVPRLHLLRARASLKARDDTGAERSLLTGVRSFETRWRALAGTPRRISYLDEGWTLFEELIHFYGVQRHDLAQAFAYAESSRARTLSARAVEEPAPTPSAIRRFLPGGAAVIYYVTLPGELLVWTLTQDAERFSILPVAGHDLAARVAAFRRLIETGRRRTELEPLAAALYDDVLRPAIAQLPHDSTVVIVPDGALHALPFAALVDRSTGEFAVQQFALGISPSAKEFVRSSMRLSMAAPAGIHALAVANPLPAGELNLPALPGAASEVADVARIYAHGATLTGAAATIAAFRNAARDADVIHFAGHARAHLRYPDLSELVLAPSPASPSGILLARDLEGWELPHTRLVVLAACETAFGSVYRGEGLVSLARPFLRAGSPAVVAALWDVDDSASRSMFSRFHHAYLAGNDAIRALRAAQLALIAEKDDDRPRDQAGWSAFVVFSGVAMPKAVVIGENRTTPADTRRPASPQRARPEPWE